MAMVNFKKGLLANLPASYAEGTFYITTDERAIYLDVDGSTRIRIGDFQEFATLSALQANANPSTSALYYVDDINCLAKWNGSEYIQINRDTGMTSVEVTGAGNAVTAAVYDATGRKLTLTKGATYMTASDVDSKISAKVGDLGDSETVKAYVDAKTAGIASDAALTELAGRVTTAEGDIDALELKVGTETVSKQIDDKIDALDLPNTYDAKGAADAVDAKLATEVGRAQAAEQANATAAANAKSAADAAQADVDALEAKVGTVAEGKTVVEMITDAQAAATYDDTAMAGRVSTVEGKVSTLIGDDASKSVRTIANEELAKQLIPEGAKESLDTLSEIAAWIQSHPEDASAMNEAITALQAKVDTGDQKVSEYVAAAISALSIGDYAKAADLTALAGRVTTAEGKITTLEAASHTHDNKAELDLIETGDKAKWDAAEQNAKDYADGLNTTMSARVKAIEDDYLKAADKTALQNAIDAEAATARAAEKANADAISAEVTRATAAEAQALTDAKSYTDGLMTWGSF